MVIRNNKITGSVGIFADWVGYAYGKNHQLVQRSSPLDILGNDITATNTIPREVAADGIIVAGWSVYFLPPYVTPPAPDWGDNGPVTISGNNVTNTQEFIPFVNYGSGICVGRSGAGLNNCRVTNNIVKGYGGDGIGISPFGHDNQVIGNDLSGFSSWSSSISICDHNSAVTNNILGKANLVPWFTCGILLYSMNTHPPKTPMPLPTENNTIANNDYTHTGCQGWRDPDAGNFNILVDTNANWGGEGTEVKNNFINETASFPTGTGGAREQIYYNPGDLVYNNRIVGLPADYVLDPGIGQRIKDARSQMMQYYAQMKGKRA